MPDRLFFTVCAKRHRDGDFVCVGGFDVCGISRPVFRNLDARRNNSCAVFGDFDTATLIRVVRADFKAVVSYARGNLINAVFPDGDALIKPDVVADGAAVVQNEISVVVIVDLLMVVPSLLLSMAFAIYQPLEPLSNEPFSISSFP